VDPAQKRAHTVMGLPKPAGVHIVTPYALDNRHRTTGINVCCVGFQSCFSLVFPCCSLRIGIFILCHCILEIRNFLFYFTEAHSEKTDLNLNRDSGHSQNCPKTMMELLRLSCSYRWAECILHYEMAMTLRRPRVECSDLDMKCLLKESCIECMAPS
jgi:hypothetical protein